MKKGLFLVLALLVAGLALTPQVQAQDAAAFQKLTDDFLAGRITQQEFERRMAELSSGLETQTPQAQPQQRQPAGGGQQYRNTYPGATTGFPPASSFRRYGKTVAQPNIQTPQGITFSYKTEGEKLIIYAFKNFSTDTVYPDQQLYSHFTDAEGTALLNHFQRALGAEIERYSNSWGSEADFYIDDPSKPPFTPPTSTKTPVTHYVIRVNCDFEHANGYMYVGGTPVNELTYAVFEIFPDQFQEHFSRF